MPLRILKNTLTIGVTQPITKSTMAPETVSRGSYVSIKVASHKDDVFRQYLWCLFIKQAQRVCGAYAEKK
ncbi:unnamed protein product [Heligmosomoides polygyrus]|uniref:Uncharacterized protein n=1 Tax=Heligmosomoides polygyrus TaxID=6339 RepID=A0A183FIV0_HELPZ|nr:unnamed protein product [Heligmosomoides polygyrus]